jgi:hypothetical protein
VGGLLDRLGEMRPDPFADEIVGDRYFQSVMLQIESRGVIEPNMKPLLSDPLRDRIGQSHELGIVCADTAHERSP